MFSVPCLSTYNHIFLNVTLCRVCLKARFHLKKEDIQQPITETVDHYTVVILMNLFVIFDWQE